MIEPVPTESSVELHEAVQMSHPTVSKPPQTPVPSRPLNVASDPRSNIWKRRRIESAHFAILQESNTPALNFPSDASPATASVPLPFPNDNCICGPDTPKHSCRANARRPVMEGETLIIQERYNRVFQTQMTRNKIMDTRYGSFAHDELIGRPAGQRWTASRHATEGAGQCAGFMHAFRLGPVGWGASVAHRTQIVHAPDAALIMLRLGVGSGDMVVEAGVGSAALSAQFAWAVAPTGRVKSFEFHEERAEEARKVLQNAGLGHVTDVTHCDVVIHGFLGVCEGEADAVFLDLPKPEAVLKEAARVLASGGRVCCFSPCVEQVLRTCEVARQCKLFHSLVTVTAPMRTHETKRARMRGEGDALASTRAQEKRDDALELETAEKHFGRVVRDKGRLASRPFSEMKGHTSFLTFATRIARTSEENRMPMEADEIDDVTNDVTTSDNQRCLVM